MTDTQPKEFFVMIYNKGKTCSSGKIDKQDVEGLLKKLQKENPGMYTDAYIAKVVEVIK